MRKLTIMCDCCRVELEENDVFKLEHYVHVSPSFNRLLGHSKVIDGKHHSVSGKMQSMDLCLPCYNEIMGKVFQHIKEKQG